MAWNIGQQRIRDVKIGGQDVREVWTWTGASWKLVWTDWTWEDTFNRANATTVGNGWVQGAQSGNSGMGIRTNCIAMSNTTDGVTWGLAPTSAPLDDYYIEATIGGHRAPQAGRPNLMYLRSNSNCTSGAWVQISSNTIAIGRLSGRNAFTVWGPGVPSTSNTSGDKFRWEAAGTQYTLRRNGIVMLEWDDTKRTQPIGVLNRNFGLGISRAAFADSGSWNDIIAAAA